MNARNLERVAPLNPRRLYPRVDDKVLTKRICEAHRIPTPRTYAVIERYGDLRRLAEILGNRRQFVVKPTRGAGGRGILVITDWDDRGFQTAGGERLSLSQVRYHLAQTLSGLYSLGGRPDSAMIEQRIVRHPVFNTLTVGGTPDIRVVVHAFAPVMAMLRLPTRASRGRANLHQGAIGVGVDLRTGRTRGAVWQNRRIAAHPDTHAPLEGVRIPFWTDILAIAARLSRALQLGYVGIDLILDAEGGPMVLEANARPGLAIQIANGRGLLEPGTPSPVRPIHRPAAPVHQEYASSRELETGNVQDA
jgi:alpha-L-glutamate ligase-like protein